MELFYQRDSLPVQSFEQDIDQDTTFKDLYEEIHKTLGVEKYLSVASEGYHPETSVSASNLIFGDTLNVKVEFQSLEEMSSPQDLDDAVQFPCPDKNKLVIKHFRESAHELMMKYPKYLVNVSNFEFIKKSLKIHDIILNHIDFDVVYISGMQFYVLKSIYNNPRSKIVFTGSSDVKNGLNNLYKWLSGPKALEYVLDQDVYTEDCLSFCIENNILKYVDRIMNRVTLSQSWWDNHYHYTSKTMRRVIELSDNISFTHPEKIIRRTNLTTADLLISKGVDLTSIACSKIAYSKYWTESIAILERCMNLPWSDAQRNEIFSKHLRHGMVWPRYQLYADAGCRAPVRYNSRMKNIHQLYRIDSERRTVDALSCAKNRDDFMEIIRMSTQAEIQKVLISDKLSRDQIRIVELCIIK